LFLSKFLGIIRVYILLYLKTKPILKRYGGKRQGIGMQTGFAI